MPTNRKLLGAAALSFALAGGGAVGALLGTPDLSLAQDSGEDTTETVDDGARPRVREHRGERLATAAEALGISEDELRAALEDGQSMAQVAEAQGIDVQVVIDALVADATERLEAAIAELPDRMTGLVNHEGLPDRGRPGGHRPGRGPNLEATAQAIGISVDELRAQLEDGSSIAHVAAANDVDVQTVIDALVADATAHLDEAVANERLSEDEANERKSGLEERITARVNGERPAGGPPEPPASDDA